MDNYLRKLLGGICFISTLCWAGDYPFSVEVERDGTVSKMIAINQGVAPVQVSVNLTEGQNIVSRQNWPVSAIVPPKSKKMVAIFSPANPHQPASFNYRQAWRLGDPGAVHDPNALYRLPFENGKVFRIGQAFGGTVTSHDSPSALYAVDIAMPEGTAIVAARAGYVIDVVKSYGAGKLEPLFLSKANLVRVLHEDGTWAAYVHLLNYSINVYPGQWVEAGTPLGLSGNSGYSSGPHLHFVVQKNDGATDISLPFKFYNDRYGVFEPQQDQVVMAEYSRLVPGISSGTKIAANEKSKMKPKPIRQCMGNQKMIDEAAMKCAMGYDDSTK